MTIARVNKLEYITETYHEYKKEKEEFIKYLNKKIERKNKDKLVDGVRDNEQQNISESGGSDGTSAGRGKKNRNNKKKEGSDDESIRTTIKGTV